MEAPKMGTVQAISHFMRNSKAAKKLHKANIYLISLLKKEQYSPQEVESIAREEYRKRTGKELFKKFYQTSRRLPEYVPDLPTSLSSLIPLPISLFTKEGTDALHKFWEIMDLLYEKDKELDPELAAFAASYKNES